jgi:hypothetical protein
MLGAVKIQTRHIASVVYSFLAAAFPVNIIKTFEMSGIHLVSEAGTLLCTVQPDKAKRLFGRLPSHSRMFLIWSLMIQAWMS